jgi:hypothetical protein
MLSAALQGVSLEDGATAGAPPAALQQQLLCAVNAALAAHPSLSAGSAEVGQLLGVLRQLGMSSEDAGVAAAATAAAERVESQQGAHASAWVPAAARC